MPRQKLVCHLALLVLIGTGSSLYAQASDPAALQQRLYAQFKLTTITADRSDIVTAGDVVAILKPRFGLPASPPSETRSAPKVHRRCKVAELDVT